MGHYKKVAVKTPHGPRLMDRANGLCCWIVLMDRADGSC